MKAEIIFVIGSGRSGSTLLRSILDGHEEILLWPFEFDFYNIINKLLDSNKKKFTISEIYQNLITDFTNFDKFYNNDLGGKKYNINNFDYNKFVSFFQNNNKEITTKEFILFLRDSYFECLSSKPNNPKYFMIFHNQPSDYILKDFPDSKMLITTRNPLDTYISIKEFYFKSCVETGRDFSCVYQPYTANPKFKTLIETSLIPIIYCNEFIQKNKIKDKFYIKLEDLRNHSNDTIDNICNFLEITKSPQMFKTTFMGQKHYSNLSNEDNPKSEILRNYKSFNYNKELSKFELYFVQKLFYKKNIYNVYSISSELSSINILSIFSILKNEIPNITAEKYQNSFVKYFIRIIIRLIYFPINYIINRYVLLTSNYQNLLKKWPYK